MTDKTEKKITTITIVNSSRVLRVWQRTGSIVIAFVAPIALGAFLDSQLMQWVGFIFGLLFIVSAAISISKKNTFESVDEAKAHLDQLKANGEAV